MGRVPASEPRLYRIMPTLDFREGLSGRAPVRADQFLFMTRAFSFIYDDERDSLFLTLRASAPSQCQLDVLSLIHPPSFSFPFFLRDFHPSNSIKLRRI